MQQTQIQNMQRELIYHLLSKTTDLANLKCDVDRLDVYKLKKCTKWFKQF